MGRVAAIRHEVKKPVLLITLAVLVLADAALILFQRLGLSSVGCVDGCSATVNLWYSDVFLAGLFVGSIAVLALRDEPKSLKVLTGFLGIAAILAFGLMLSNRIVCPLCIVAQSLWLFIAVTGVFGSRAGSWFIGVAVGLSALPIYELWKLNRPAAKPVAIGIRGYEHPQRSYPNAFVVFTDPCCPYCKELESKFDPESSSIPVIYRWNLLPQHGDAAVKLACVIESALREDTKKGEALRRKIFLSSSVPDLKSLALIGPKVGFDGKQLVKWYQTPDSEVLTLVENDAKLASQIYVRKVPSLAIMTTPSESNQSSVRLIDQKELQYMQPAVSANLAIFNVFYGGHK